MRYLRFLTASAAAIAFVYLLHTPLSIGENTLPPLGLFFSPQHGYWQNAEPASPVGYSLDLTFDGLRDDVTLLLDQDLVPRIYAQHVEDAVFAQGYVTAMLRLFQMDISTRAPAGRLSEIMGERTLEYDLGQRRKGLREAAERQATQWMADPEVGPYFEAYLRGINAYIRQLKPADYPIEYKLLHTRPEPWEPWRIAAFYLAMSETLARTAHDIPLGNAYTLFGPETFDLLYPNRNPYDIPVIPDSLEMEYTPGVRELPLHGQLPAPSLPLWGYADYLPPGQAGIGSNNWALAPERTANGHAILCNDPHLALTLPSIWLEMQITLPQSTAYGVAFTCIPGIAIGFNDHMAWGFTNAGHDVLDWFRIDWTDDTKTRYRYADDTRAATLVVEEVTVKGWKTPFRDTVRYTIWGPVPQLKSDQPGADLAMKWLPTMDIEPLIPIAFPIINQATSKTQWLEVLHRWDAPMQNAIYADRQGNIGIHLSGKMPVRGPDTGRLPFDGSDPTVGWQGFHPPQQNPQVFNPPSGYVASANQQSTGDDWPHYYTGIFEDWRGRYVNEQLRDMEAVTIADMMALQNDNTSLKAREALPVLLGLLDTERLDTESRAMADALQKWDHRFDPGLQTPVVFELWIKQVDSLAWDEIYVLHDSLPVEVPEVWRLLELLVQEPHLSWWDIQSTPETETAADVVRIAFERALSRYSELQSKGIDWTSYLDLVVRHIARIDAFSARDIGVGGHHSALNAMTATNGPSWRMIVELGPEIQAFGVYPGGQSGNPGSPHYRSFLPTWQKGQYRTLAPWPDPKTATQNALVTCTLRKKSEP
jgi:penicillin amidase